MKVRALTHNELMTFEHYAAVHAVAFQNPVIQSFFRHTPHVITLVSALTGDLESWSRIQQAFQQHLFHLRFIRYLASIVQLSTLSFIRSNQKIQHRNPLIVDGPISKDNRGDRPLFLEFNPSIDFYFKQCSSFAETIEDEKLYGSFRLLTRKQQEIVMMSYVLCYRDTEIAQSLRVSPQAVFKTRQKALRKLRSSVTEKGVKKSG